MKERNLKIGGRAGSQDWLGLLPALDAALEDLRDWAHFCRETHERAEIGIAPTAPHLAGFERTHDVMDGLRTARLCVVGLIREKERLDWLADRDNPFGNVQLPTECVAAHLTDMRAAIDAAMLLRPDARSAGTTGAAPPKAGVSA